jgi:hypothetical protein
MYQLILEFFYLLLFYHGHHHFHNYDRNHPLDSSISLHRGLHPNQLDFDQYHQHFAQIYLGQTTNQHFSQSNLLEVYGTLSLHHPEQLKLFSYIV